VRVDEGILKRQQIDFSCWQKQQFYRQRAGPQQSGWFNGDGILGWSWSRMIGYGYEFVPGCDRAG
jgi:hypothetical protein